MYPRCMHAMYNFQVIPLFCWLSTWIRVISGWLWGVTIFLTLPGLVLGLRPANQRHRYKATPSLIGWAQTLTTNHYNIGRIASVNKVHDDPWTENIFNKKWATCPSYNINIQSKTSIKSWKRKPILPTQLREYSTNLHTVPMSHWGLQAYNSSQVIHAKNIMSFLTTGFDVDNS